MPRAGIHISIVSTGIPKTLKRLKGMSDRAKDLRPVWPKIADDWGAMNAMTFQRDGASPGWSKWKPISPKYAAWKAARGFDSAILRMTGTLKNSLVKRADGNFLFRPTKNKVTLGTTVPYASFHTDGREPIRHDKDSAKRWAEIIKNFILTGQK